jgi:16S rRNA (cytosine967-C5)-methyltransferase
VTTLALSFSHDDATRVRPLVLRAYDEARAGRWPFLSDVLEKVLRGVGEEDGGIAAAAVQALVKYDRLLAFACGGEQANAGARLDALLALAKGETDALARAARIERATERLGVLYSIPDWIVELVSDEPTLARMNQPAARTLRVNTLKTSRESCIQALASEGLAVRPTATAASGVVLEGRRSPFRTQAFARGDFEMQDEGSQLVAELVAPPPRSFVIDACAGAGGKTLALAALLGNKGKILALDTSKDKLSELQRRARRAGASNVQALAVDVVEGGEALRHLEGRARRVVVDAPCTGLGAIRRNPEARWRLRPDDVVRLAAAQGALTRSAARLVAPGGRLVFATCSFLAIEGEQIIDAFLASDSGFALVTARDVLGRARTERIATADGRYVRTWRTDPSLPSEASPNTRASAPESDSRWTTPGDDGIDGFFAAVLRRTKPLLA